MAVVSVLACDVCNLQPADTWRILQAGQTEFLVDLCSDHAASLRGMKKYGRTEQPATRRRTGLTKSITYEPPDTP